MIFFFSSLSFLVGLHFILAPARSEKFLFSEPTEPNFNDLGDVAIFNLGEDDPLNNAYLNPDEFTWDVFDPALNPINQDEADTLINLAKLPDSCGTKDSLTNGVLRARDGASCSPRKDHVNLPNGPFQDPSVLPLPSESLDGGNIEEGDLGFGTFMRNRFSVAPLEPNPQICDPRIFGLSDVPMCNNPLTGSVAKEPSQIYQYKLINAVACRCFISSRQGEY